MIVAERQETTQLNGGTSDSEESSISIQDATALCEAALRTVGYSSEQAAIITDHLVDAEMRGHPFAGLARALSIIEYLKTSGMGTNKDIEITRIGPTFAHLDGHDSVGYLVANQAIRLAIDKAKTAGVSVVGANGLWYSGNLAYYAEMATRENLVVFIASNGTPIVAPHGGYEPKFCTNPFCIGIPSKDSDAPIIWDIGTSNIMYAQVKLAERLGINIPEGSAYDGYGNPTVDPVKALTGALTAWGGYKGSGLAVMVQLLGIVAGSTEPTPMLSGFGFLVLAFDPSILQPLDQVKQETEKFSDSIRATKMLPGEKPARMPFERSSECRKEAKAKGYLSVPRRVVQQLQTQGASTQDLATSGSHESEGEQQVVNELGIITEARLLPPTTPHSTSNDPHEPPPLAWGERRSATAADDYFNLFHAASDCEIIPSFPAINHQHMADDPQTRNRRARLVCLQCHNRKLRCDLENRKKEGALQCRHCLESATICQPRTSKRLKRDVNAAKTGTGSSYAPIRPAVTEGTVCASTSDSQQLFPQQHDLDEAGSLIANVHRAENAQIPNDFNLGPCEVQSPSLLSVPQLEDDTPGILSNASHGTAVGYLGGSGLLSLFEPDSRGIARDDQQHKNTQPSADDDLPPLELQQSFSETYFDYCWPWCPVLDKTSFWQDDSDSTPPPLLTNALALLGTQVRPPIMQHASAGEYYTRAKMQFYMDEESNPLVCLQAIMLFYWWAPRGPSMVHKDAAWWWTGVAIKYAQQMGLHREPKSVDDVGGAALQGLRRRIWWTLFARERLTAMCQGRPLTIQAEDCDVREPSMADFAESDDRRAEIFIQWVRLCDIIGRVSQHLSRPVAQVSFPTVLAEELAAWVGGLPEHLRLSDMSDRKRRFDRDVLKLHLPYLTTVTILHLNWSSRNPSQPWPEAYTAAVLSASCVTRIFKDLLARGELRYLGAIACWYTGVAIVALLHTQRIEALAESGAEDIRVLRLALNELAKLWPSTAIFVKGFDRLRAFENLGRRPTLATGLNPPFRQTATESAVSLSDWPDDIDWRRYLPHVTTKTCQLASILVAEYQPGIWEDLSWVGDATGQFQDLFDMSSTVQDPSFEMLSSLCWAGDPGGRI